MQTSPPNGDNYLWRCGPLKGSSSLGGFEASYQRKEVPDKMGPGSFTSSSHPSSASPGKKAALKKKLPRVATYSSSYNSQEQAEVPLSLSTIKFQEKFLSCPWVSHPSVGEERRENKAVAFVFSTPEVHCNL